MSNSFKTIETMYCKNSNCLNKGIILIAFFANFSSFQIVLRCSAIRKRMVRGNVRGGGTFYVLVFVLSILTVQLTLFIDFNVKFSNFAMQLITVMPFHSLTSKSDRSPARGKSGDGSFSDCWNFYPTVDLISFYACQFQIKQFQIFVDKTVMPRFI